MYISQSKNLNNSKYYKGKENEKGKDKKSLSQKLFNQKKYVKILPSKKLTSRNNDYIKKNIHKIIIRNKSNIEHSIKFISNENSLIKNRDNLMNKAKNLLNYQSDIYTPKPSKNLSSSNIYYKSKNEKNNFNIKQKNLINDAKRNNIFLINFFGNKSSKNKKEAQQNDKNKIINSYNNKLLKSFINAKKPEISFKNFSSNSSLNIFSNTHNDAKIDINFSHNNSKKDEININLISKIQKNNKIKTHFNNLNINNKNIGAYLKKIYFNSNEYLKESNVKNNRNNNNYILINHLLLNDINITGNNNGNIIDKNLENLKPNSSRNEKFKKENELEEIINNSNDENNDIIYHHENYISLSESNVNCQNLNIKKKINLYKCKYNENISPEEAHFKVVEYLQKVEISKHKIK